MNLEVFTLFGILEKLERDQYKFFLCLVEFISEVI